MRPERRARAELALTRLSTACSRRSWSPTAARSRSASSARCDEMGIASVAVYSELDRDALHVAARRRGLPAGRPDRGRELPQRRADPRGRAASRAPRPCTPATASWPRTRRFAQACEDAGITFIGPPASAIEAMGSKTRARELMQAAGVPIVPGTTEPVATRRGRAQDHRRRHRLPGRGQGRGRRRRQGLPRRAARSPSSRPPSRAPRARARSSSPTRPSTSSATCPTRATSRSRSSPTATATSSTSASATARSSAATRSSSRSPPRRRSTTTLRERIGKIGVEAARAVDYVGAGTIEGLLAGRRVLLPGDEHPRAGRALRDRDGRRASTSSREGIRAAAGEELSSPRTTSCCAATRSSAASTPRTPRRTSPRRPGRIATYREPAGPGVRVDCGVGAGQRDHADVRPDGGQAHRLGRRPRAGHARACCARWASTRSAA